ncbi:MAG: ferritin [Chloroflexi bacterium]|nr:ferritin [Chloroflexota bacterium]
MLSDRMKTALNDQINMEFGASFQYLAMAAYFEAENLLGFANWMHVQAEEENGHAMKFYHYINSRRGRVTLKALSAPKTEWSSPLEAFQDALKHEQKVTASINNLVNLAIQESDHATNSFLQWFVDEQVEEEASVDAVIQDLKRIGDSSQGLFMLDRELAGRQPEAEAEAE